DQPVRARRISSAERVWRWGRRNPVLAGLCAAVLLLLVVTAVGSSVAALWLSDALATAQREKAEKTTHLWEAFLASARASRLTSLLGRRFNSLAAVDRALELVPARQLDADRLLALRNEAVAALCLADCGTTRGWEGFKPDTTLVACDTAFAHYARG